MKRLLLFSLALSIFALPSHAQSVDASVGYSYFRLGGSGGLNQNGISGSVAYKPIPYLGIVGDVGGYHASPGGVSVNTYTFLFGPRIIVSNPTTIKPFVQFLAGAGRIAVGNGGGSTTDFAYSVGGGVDFTVLPHLALRPQLDYVGIRTPGSATNCTRVSVSAVIHF
ncbi:MAG TPA: outer membrane beta-barrel protein [Candidatus Solibacter sp.]|nr:outer membrane beta-barrel protein [Candidatus Solibacter sp.]